jgi:hypothetical protein
MKTGRTIAALAAAAAAALATGCGSSCKNETPVVAESGVPSCGALAPSATIRVDLHVCPSCSNQAACSVDASQLATSGIVFLEPQAEVCQDSCPLENPSGCPFQPLSCTFTAPATPASTTYFIYVADPTAPEGHRVIPFNVGGTETSCTFG